MASIGQQVRFIVFRWLTRVMKREVTEVSDEQEWWGTFQITATERYSLERIINRKLKIELPDDEFISTRTIGELVHLVDRVSREQHQEVKL